MTRLIAGLILLSAVGISQQAPATSTPGTVNVHAWVEKADGLPASKMSPADFELLVDGQPVAIEQIAPARNGTSIVVLADTSRSVTWDRRVLEEHMNTFAAALGPQDRTSFASFGARSHFPPFAAAGGDIGDQLRVALERGDREGYRGSPAWDAIYEAVTILSREPPPRAILLLSDGRSTANRYGLNEVADYAMTHGVCLDVVLRHSSQWITQGEGKAALVQPGAPLQGLASFTGGMYFTYPERQEEQAKAVFKRIASTLAATHLFTFAPPQLDKQPHRLVIRPKRVYVNVHAPFGFVAQ